MHYGCLLGFVRLKISDFCFDLNPHAPEATGYFCLSANTIFIQCRIQIVVFMMACTGWPSCQQTEILACLDGAPNHCNG